MQLSYKLQKGAGFILAIFPAFFLGLLILKYSVNIPYWDQWRIAPLFEKVEHGSLTFSDLIAQHNESRKFFSRLIFIGLAFLTHWDVRYEMLVIFLFACLLSLNVYYLSKLTVGGSTLKRLLLATISNLLIFSPIQYENWLWGIQIVVFIPIVCITTCILVSYSRLAARAKFLISMCLSTVSTFSYANGLLCWLVLFPILVLKSRNELNKNRWLIFAWIAGFISNAVLYFYNYQKPGHHPSFWEAIKYPLRSIHYLLSFFGAPLGFGIGTNPLNISTIITTSTVIGLAIVLIFLASCLYILRFSKDFNLLNRVAGWLTIALYTLASAIITTLGRVGFGVEQSLSSRYTTFSVYLTVCLIYIVAIIIDDIKKKDLVAKNIKSITKFSCFLTAIIVVFHVSASTFAVNCMHDHRIDLLQRKSCLAFINIVQEDCLKKVFPYVDYLKYVANDINRLGFLNPGLVKSSRIQDIEVDKNMKSLNYGVFDVLKKASKDEYVASGWAVLPARREPADSVILTYANAEGNSTVFALANVRTTARYDVAKTLKQESYFSSGWQKKIPVSKLPKDAIKLDAWAFDSNTGKAFHLNGTHVILR